MCVGAHVHVCLIMCAYRCLCIRIWPYDMLRRRNLGNYSPMFKAIKNVISFSTCSLSNLSYLFNRMESNRMVICGWLYVAYVGDCIVKSGRSLLTLCASLMCLKIIFKLRKHTTTKTNPHMLMFIFYVINRMTV